MEKKKFSDLEELEKWIAQYDTKDEAMQQAGYASGRKQYKRFKDDFENKPKKKPSKKSVKKSDQSTRVTRKKQKTELLQLNWQEIKTYIIEIKSKQFVEYGEVEPELKRFIDNVIDDSRQYRVVKDYHNFVNGYLRKKGIEVVI